MLGHTTLPSSEGVAPSQLCATSQMARSVLMMPSRPNTLLKREMIHEPGPSAKE
jgi:hypothetical protein